MLSTVCRCSWVSLQLGGQEQMPQTLCQQDLLPRQGLTLNLVAVLRTSMSRLLGGTSCTSTRSPFTASRVICCSWARSHGPALTSSLAIDQAVESCFSLQNLSDSCCGFVQLLWACVTRGPHTKPYCLLRPHGRMKGGEVMG